MQFGDEGKGKITDYLAEKSDFVFRYGGGNNAGHTVVVEGKTYKLHLLPSGVVRGKRSLLGAGVVIDPQVLLDEISALGKKPNLGIDPRAHIIMPYHKYLDANSEAKKGENQIGTTGRGIGPCYADKAERTGIRFEDLLDNERLEEKLRQVLPIKEKILKHVYGVEFPHSLGEIVQEYSAYGEKLREFEADASLEIAQALKAKKSILLEGAQGTFLDINFGTYPFVTSSIPIAPGAGAGIGFPAAKTEKVVGVAKAYTTRVGAGPFATELLDGLGDRLRTAGNEFGTTTGRPRRVGWLDMVLLRTAARLNGVTEIALTKLDVLSGVESLEVCVAYDCNGKKTGEFPAKMSDAEKCVPIYKTLNGFSITGSEKKFSALDRHAQEYVKFVEKELGVPVSIVSTGPKRSQTIMKK